jgi:hypothetical protein
MLQFLPRSFWGSISRHAEVPIVDGDILRITDTVAPGPVATSDAREVLNALFWPNETFDVHCQHTGDAGDATLRFPSPLPLGHEVWDEVIMDWYIARDRSGQSTTGPAVLILDILQGGNMVSNFIARALAKNGIHGFVMHMPQSGNRRRAGEEHSWAAFLPGLRQAAGDARRARDIIAALPTVVGPIGLQGTSLGGFVATLAGSIDNAFDPVLLALTGGDVYGVLTRGKMDAIRVRKGLMQAGYTDQKIHDFVWSIEPLRIVHRLDPRRTWLFSARHDQVVSAIHGKKLAAEIGLPSSHHRQFAGCHYTCVIGAARFLQEIIRTVPKRGLEMRSA